MWGSVFVRLCPFSSSLCSLVCERNELAPKPLPKNFSLTTSTGLAVLKKARNEFSAELASAPPPGNACLLFADDCANKRPKPPPRATRGQNDEMRSNAEAIAVAVSVGGEQVGIVVLRHVKTTDAVFIEYESENCKHVLRLLRESGFNEVPYTHDQTLPKGIRKRGGGYLVVHTAAGGHHKYVKSSSFEHAMETQAQLLLTGESGPDEPTMSPDGSGR